MSHVFSTRCEPPLMCETPVLTVSFPRHGCPGPNSVVLANGAVVDLNVLGEIIGQICPAVLNAPCLPETTQIGTMMVQSVMGITGTTVQVMD